MRITLLAVAMALFASVLPVSAQAVMQHYQLNIPKQPLDAALRDFASQTGLQIARMSDTVDGSAMVGPVNGELSAEEALKALLTPRGLSYKMVNERTIAIFKPGSASTLSSTSGSGGTAQTAQPTQARPSQEGDQSVWDRFRVAQAGQGQAAEVGPAEKETGEASATKPGQLAEVIVTARKQEERLQDVPSAISAVTGDTLEAMGAQSFVDYARTIPSLNFRDFGNGQQQLSIRGVSATIGADTVGYYLDETPIASNRGTINPDLVDLNRIEVLRGPQGTLYGSESIGGTIKLIPNEPNLSKVEGQIEGTGMVAQGADGASPGGRASLVLNMPIVDGVAAIRGVAWGKDIGGVINRTYGYTGDFGNGPHPVGTVGNIPDEHTWGFRVNGLVQATEKFSVAAMIFFQNQHFNGFQDITGGASNPNHDLVQNFISDVAEGQNNRFTLYNLKLNYNFGPVNFLSSTSYHDNSDESHQEGTSVIQYFIGGTPFPNSVDTSSTNHVFTEEARLATSERLYGFDGLVGVYYSRTHGTNEFRWAPAQYNSVIAGNDPTNPLYAPDNILFNDNGEAYERQTAEFGELTYHFTEALSATAGLRHYVLVNGQYLVQEGIFTGSPVPVSSNVTASAAGFVGKGNVSYNLTPDKLIYAQYSGGFRPAYPNSPLPPQCNAPPGALEAQPDHIKNYELGAKSQWLDRQLIINAAIYRIDWTEIQQSITPPCGFNYVGNFGDARIKGAELELSAQVTKQLSTGLSGSYTNAQLLQDVPSLNALAGDQIEYVPYWQFALYAQSTFPISEVTSGFARIDYQYTGSSWGNYNRLADGTRDPLSKLDVTRLLNLKTGMHHRNWDFSLSVTNLLNQIATQSVDANAGETVVIPGRPRYVVNRPRTFMLGVAYAF